MLAVAKGAAVLAWAHGRALVSSSSSRPGGGCSVLPKCWCEGSHLAACVVHVLQVASPLKSRLVTWPPSPLACPARECIYRVAPRSQLLFADSSLISQQRTQQLSMACAGGCSWGRHLWSARPGLTYGVHVVACSQCSFNRCLGLFSGFMPKPKFISVFVKAWFSRFAI